MVIMIDHDVIKKALYVMANRQQWEDEYTEALAALRSAYNSAIKDDDMLKAAAEFMKTSQK